MDTLTIWLEFLACTVVILCAGTQVAKYGDCIAEKTQMGSTWVGLVLLSSVTSLPELVTGISSVTVFDLPDIAVGDILGSCMLNVLIIGLLDGLAGKKPFSRMVHQGHTLAAGFVIISLGLAAIDLAAGKGFLSLGWIDIFSPFYIIGYLIAMRTIFLHERRRLSEFVTEMAQQQNYDEINLSKAIVLFTFNSLLIICAAIWLPNAADKLAAMTGLGHNIVGIVLVALTTSLPEIVVSISACRLGSFDMAIASLLGSNLLNIAIIAIDDLAYVKGPLLEHVSPNYVVSAVAAMIMTAVVIVGLTFRAESKPLKFGWEALSILTIYIVANYFLFVMK